MEEKNKLINIICNLVEISKDELLNKRTKIAVYARLILYRHYQLKGLQHQQIAEMFEKSRSTVTYQLSGFKLTLKYDKQFREYYNQFCESLDDK